MLAPITRKRGQESEFPQQRLPWESHSANSAALPYHLRDPPADPRCLPGDTFRFTRYPPNHQLNSGLVSGGGKE